MWLDVWLDDDMTNDPYEVHQLNPAAEWSWAVGDDDHRFPNQAEAQEYADWLRRQS